MRAQAAVQQEQVMGETKLTISGPTETEQVILESKGATIGRDPRCNIRLDHSSISRMHARVYRDPFGRWIIEDLDSQNGVFIDGQRVKAHAVLPGQKIAIRPFALSLSELSEKQTIPDSSIKHTSSVVDKGMEEELISYQEESRGILSAQLIHHLNEITSRLLELHSPTELYNEACYCLAKMLDGLVAFVRLPAVSEPLPATPPLLARHFGSDASRDTTPETSNIYLSKRVLDAVRTARTPIMARSGPSTGKQLVLTIVDERTPHAVFAAPVNEFEGRIDALYLDILEDRSPTEMFDFVEAVARQINFAQKSLFLSEAKAERRILDRQLALAREIQANLVPSGLDRVFEVDVAVCYEPAMWVGGDYCDVWPLQDGRMAFAVGDVSGKGLPAAMIMSNLQAALRTTMTFCSELSTVAEHVNRHLCRNLREDMFVTLFLGVFDRTKNQLTYVNAGHIMPLIMRPGESARMLGEPANPPLGILEGPLEMTVETLEPATSLLVFTDGITEASCPEGQQYQTQRLAQLMTETKAKSAQELVKAVTDGVAAFRQTLPQHDDVTVFSLINRRRTIQIV